MSGAVALETLQRRLALLLVLAAYIVLRGG